MPRSPTCDPRASASGGESNSATHASASTGDCSHHSVPGWRRLGAAATTRRCSRHLAFCGDGGLRLSPRGYCVVSATTWAVQPPLGGDGGLQPLLGYCDTAGREVGGGIPSEAWGGQRVINLYLSGTRRRGHTHTVTDTGTVTAASCGLLYSACSLNLNS